MRWPYYGILLTGTRKKIIWTLERERERETEREKVVRVNEKNIM
jgi:hypothetical protein